MIYQKNTPTTASDGQQVAAWADQFTRMAEVVPRTGRESRVFEQMRAEVDHLVRVPYDPQTAEIVPANWRIKIGTRYLNIGSSYDVHSDGAAIEMQCTEVVV